MARTVFRTSCALLSMLLFKAGAAVAQADRDTASNEALATISTFAREFCLSADSTSHNTSVELSGDAKVKLNSIISKVVDLEVGGGGKYIDSKTEGVLQKDLAAAYQDTNRCRMAALELLANRLLPPQVPDASASKMAGRWQFENDNKSFVNVVIHGRDFRAVEYNRHGKPSASIDAKVTDGNVEGIYFFEPQSGLTITERLMVGTVNMRLSQNDQRLVGTLVTKTGAAIKIEWVRP